MRIGFVSMVVALVLPLPAYAQIENLRFDGLVPQLEALRSARAACDWDAVSIHSMVLEMTAPEACDAWFEAKAALVALRYRGWDTHGLSTDYREAMAAKLQRDRPVIPGFTAAFDRYGPLTPAARADVASIELAAARVHQSEGQHDVAVMSLEGVIEDLSSGLTPAGEIVMREAMLDHARGLALLGRKDESNQALARLRDYFPGSVESAIASVLLQEAGEGTRAYRGKYVGDEEHRARMASVRAVLPTARERVATALGIELEALPKFPIGVADTPQRLRHANAVTKGDPRRPKLLPVIVVFSESLARSAMDLEDLLVHELTHAALLSEFGRAYEEWPAWLVEGLPLVVSGGGDLCARLSLEGRLMQNPAAFVDPRFWSVAPIELPTDPCRQDVTIESGLLATVLEPESLPKLLAALRGGAKLDDAFSAAGLGSVADFEARSLPVLRERLEAVRGQSMAAVVPLVNARALGPKSSLECAQEQAKLVSSPLARGFALWEAARSLEFLGRIPEAQQAYDVLIAERRDHPAYLDLALSGKVRCLFATGRSSEARAVLEQLVRDTLDGSLLAWAQNELRRLQPR